MEDTTTENSEAPQSCSSTHTNFQLGLQADSLLQESSFQSPLQHLLSDTKRHVPSESEEVQVRAIIKDAEQRIADIDATRARIVQVLLELDQERVKVQEYADRHRVMVAPIWYIPPEILSCIFMLCIPSPSRSPQDISRSSLKLSLLVSAVDQNWRNVALSTPQLWTTMILDHDTFSSSCMPKIFLERSGDLPLSLYVRAKGRISPEDFVGFLASLSTRWQDITLEADANNARSILSTSGSSFPFLRTLDLQINGWEGVDPNLFEHFQHVPALQHVSTTGTFRPDGQILPWKQLRTWDSVASLQDIPQIFSLAPNLESCFIQPSRLSPLAVIPEFACGIARKLTYLHISTGMVTNISVQLHHLPYFPSLRSLFIYFDKRVGVTAPEANLIPLFVRSGALLENLTIAISMQVGTLQQCLTHTPALTTLQMHRITTEAMLTLLANSPNPDSPFLLPRLTTLRLSGKILYSARNVINVINTRWSEPASSESQSPADVHDNVLSGEGVPTAAMFPRCLKSVHILPPRQDRFHLPTKRELLAFGDKGFDIQINQLDRTAFLRHVVP